MTSERWLRLADIERNHAPRSASRLHKRMDGAKGAETHLVRYQLLLGKAVLVYNLHLLDDGRLAGLAGA
jgi:hypothetical protein